MDEVVGLVDAVVHMGNASVRDALAGRSRNLYSRVENVVIPHPTYDDLDVNIDKDEARRRLGIPCNAKVCLVFGELRTACERSFVSQVWGQVSVSNKLLLVPRWFGGRLAGFRMFIEKGRQLFGHVDDSVMLGCSFVEVGRVKEYFRSADVVFVPRIGYSNLNSGVVPLAVTFRVPTVGPDSGVMGEVLREAGGKVFSPSDSLAASRQLEESLSGPAGPEALCQMNSYAEGVSAKVVGEMHVALYRRLIAAR